MEISRSLDEFIPDRKTQGKKLTRTFKAEPCMHRTALQAGVVDPLCTANRPYGHET
jgi:hypothetical protein